MKVNRPEADGFVIQAEDGMAVAVSGMYLLRQQNSLIFVVQAPGD